MPIEDASKDQQFTKGWRRRIWSLASPISKLTGSRKVDGCDWNYWWFEQFKQYELLPKQLEGRKN